jgi:PAS domain S-box-containing protein
VIVTATIRILLAILSGPWSLIGPSALLFPMLLWLGYRCRPVFAAAAVFTIAAAIVWTTTYERGLYGDPARPIAIRVRAAQITILGTTLVALALAALFAERRRSEGALRDSDKRLRSILDAANVIAWDVDLIRNTVHSTGPVARLLHRSEGSLPPDLAAMVETIHPEDRDSVMAQFWTAISTAATYRFEFRLNAEVLHWVTAEGSIERDAHGRAVRVRGVTLDISKRKKAELALAEREAQLGLAGKAARVDSFVVDYTTNRIQTSPGYAAIHGLAEGTEELTREEWRAHVLPDDLARLDALRRQVFAQRRGELNIEYRIVGADGKRRWIESRGIVSYDGDGCPTRLVGVHIDITERKLAEGHLRMMVAELDHRVKNVLATVSALTLRTQDACGSVADFAAALDGRIQSMAATHQLLSGQQWKGILLSDLARCELAPYATRDNTEIDGPDITLKAEAAQAVSMVLHELATNAVKHGALSTPDGRVAIRWYRLQNGDADARLCVEWQETGGPAVRAPGRCGYGLEVIRGLLPYELDGKVDLALAAEGVRCRFDIPLSQLTGGDRLAGALSVPLTDGQD